MGSEQLSSLKIIFEYFDSALLWCGILIENDEA